MQNFTTSFSISVAAATGAVTNENDPFSRRRTLPKLFVKSASAQDEPEGKQDATNDNNNNNLISNNSNNNHTVSNGTPSNGTPAKPITPSTSAGPSKSLEKGTTPDTPDIDIDIDISSSGATPKVPKAPRAVLASTSDAPAAAPKATMTLLDYRKRRGLQ